MRVSHLPLLTLLATPAVAQDASFPFVMPWDDAAKNAVDVSFLNPAPLTEKHRVVVRGGQFRDLTGRRVRFLGNNLTFNANFPNKDDAPKIAARMHKLGFNIMRLHHMDFFKAPRGIFDANFPDTQHLDAEQLDRLDWLLYQFAQHGIYANLNLHVSRAFTAADGFPDTDKIPGLGKVTSYFEPRMIELQKNFARDLLNHVNPYTKQRWGDDPVFALIEINNEDTLVGEAFGDGLNTLPPHYKNILMTRWNGFLKQKYASTAAMLQAWNGNSTLGNNVLFNPQLADGNASWTLEQQPATKAEMTVEEVVGEAETGALPAGRALHYKTLQKGEMSWHVQGHQNGLDLQAGQSYTLKFWARADKPRRLSVYTGNDQTPWRHVGLERTIELGPKWKKFTFVFAANTDVIPMHSRLSWILGGEVGDLWLAGLSLRAGRAIELEAGESIEQGSVTFPMPEMPGAGADFIGVLMEIENQYAQQMRDYIKTDLKAKSLVTCSQASYGGVAGVWRESQMDWVDMHAYWQHPNFPRRQWDFADWNIPNTSMTRDPNGGTLPGLAMHRVAGKPFTVSEYNHAAPNDFQAETLPLICAYAARQDWDGVFLFDYHGDRDSLNNQRIKGFFSTDTNPAKMALMPAAAMLFLRGDVASDNAESGTLFLPTEAAKIAALTAGNGPAWNQLDRVWRAALTQDKVLFGTNEAFNRKLSIGFGAGYDKPVYERGGNPSLREIQRDSWEVVWRKWSNVDTGSPIPGLQVIWPFPGLQVTSSSTVAFVSHYRGNEASVELGPATLKLRPTTPQSLPFVSLTLSALDGDTLQNSSRLLLTAVGKVENIGMKWNETRTSVSNQWGEVPTMAEGISGEISLNTNLKTAQIWALKGNGERVKLVPSELKDGVLRFSIGPEHQTVWYEIAAPDAK